MLKKLVLKVAAITFALAGTIGFAFAQVDVNKADQAALETIKGIGPSTSAKILDARKKGGAFKSWADLNGRVSGIGDKTAVKLSDGGLTVNGQSLPNAGVVPAFAAKSKQSGMGSDAPNTQALAQSKKGSQSYGKAPTAPATQPTTKSTTQPAMQPAMQPATSSK